MKCDSSESSSAKPHKETLRIGFIFVTLRVAWRMSFLIAAKAYLTIMLISLIITTILSDSLRHI
jgi:hypothetical protein